MIGIVWTPGLDARLLELHAAGLIFRDIAHTLNAEFDTELTRNACIGRAPKVIGAVA